jgi:hypothetical protein
MRRRRFIPSKHLFDICFRAVQGLPLPARPLTALLIESILARILATEQVILCGYVWMANHPHIQVFSLDSSALCRFHGRVKKRLTDFLKRLLGLSHLLLWDSRTTIGEVLDLDAAIDRIVYAFLNPVRAKLVRSIDEYNGCNTWKEFLSAPADLHAVIEKEVPWILATDLGPLSHSNPSEAEEMRIIQRLKNKAASREAHVLRIHPFRWLEAFGIRCPEEIERVRARIVARVREGEAALAPQINPSNRIEGYVVTNDYTPPPRERMVFMYGSTPENRVNHLENRRWIEKQCNECFQLMRQGAASIPWPPGCFAPPAPILYNSLR